MISEPCCVHKLVRALHEAPHRVLTFHTYGDVVFEKFYHALACLMADTHVLVLTMERLDIPTANYLRHCFDRCWITDLVLTTRQDNEALVRSTLENYLTHVSYTHSPSISPTSGQMVLYTSPAAESPAQMQALILSGNIPYKVNGELTTYTLQFQPSVPALVTGDCGDWLANALLPLTMLHRPKVVPVRGASEALRHFRNYEYIHRPIENL